MTKVLAKTFKTPKDAEVHFHGMVGPKTPGREAGGEAPVNAREPPEGATLYIMYIYLRIYTYNYFCLSISGCSFSVALSHNPLSQDGKIKSLSDSLSTLATSLGISVPTNFIGVSLQAMANLQKSGRSNVFYRLGRGLSTMRKDGSGFKFPTHRMPMGLLEYMVGFFDSQTPSQV